MKAFRQRSASLALATCIAFLASLLPVRPARAEDGPRGSAVAGVAEAVKSTAPADSRAVDQAQLPPWRIETRAAGTVAASPASADATPPGRAPTQERAQVASSRVASEVTQAIAAPSAGVAADNTRKATSSAAATQSPSVTVDALPIAGGDKTGVSSQAISLPQGTGKIQGMGESFSTQMSTGVATFMVPFSLVTARGGAQPSLSLSYSSSSGHGVAGVGWEVGVPFIARQTDRGLPQYNDPTSGFAPSQDRFVFNGGQELVPICVVTGGMCAGAQGGEQMPPWAEDGSQYFRARVEGSFLRFFWSADHRTWRVQSKSGTTMELGVPLDNSSYVAGIETDPFNPSHIFRWNLVREYDAYGGANPTTPGTAPTPVNVVVFRYLQDGNMAYLLDIYDTPPVANTTTAPLSAYAHHVRLAYQPRSDVTLSFRRGWQTTQAQRLLGVDVTSQTFGGGALRNLVRRYHLSYDAKFHVSLLSSVQMEGRCVDGSGSEMAMAEDASGNLAASTSCPMLPAMAFGYQHVTPYAIDGSPATADLAGYEGFDERVIALGKSPPNSIDQDVTDLFDINADGLPDVVTTLPGSDSRFPLYFNGAGGLPNTFGSSSLGVLGVLGATANDINLANSNVAVSDINGDGTIDWLHQPAVKSFAIYAPKLVNGSWFMAGRAVPTSAFQDPHLDLGEDTPDINVVDANGDGLVDVVRTTGSQVQTFFALGRYPGGDGNFGSATWTGPTTASLSLQFVPSCVPVVAPGAPVRFSDKTIHLADMNGDGLQDIVYVKQGLIRYWPGRGDGSWGTGPLGGCTSGFAENTFIEMSGSPEYSDTNGGGLRLDDVNGDGLDDLVQFRFDAVDVWLNVDGVGWTPKPHTIQGVQPAQGPLWFKKTRLVDINGSGTRDVLWGEGGNYRYMDLAGGQRPWVLTHVQNGLGKTTDLTYASSTQLMLADAAAGNAWSSVAPMPQHVVTQVTESDHMDSVGRAVGTYVTQYSYRDAVYDGRQREFRGFRTARERKVGDANSPSSTTESTFLLGECTNDESVAPDPCTPDGAWQGNPREALKGLPLLSETHDDGGVYQSTTHHTYRLRKLYTGLDGREVRHAFESQTDTYLYDDGPFVPAPQPTSLTDVELETVFGTFAIDTASSPTLRSTSGRAHTHKVTTVDFFGNATDAIDSGCVDGCLATDEIITTHSTPGLVCSSGWLFQTVESYVLGSATFGRRNDHLTTYDCGGNPILEQGVLFGTFPLDRFHQTGATVAPAPPSASADGTILMSSDVRDGFGQLLHQAAPNGRCRDVTYDTLYDQVPVLETVSAGSVGSNGCGATPLNTVVTNYDRGLDEVLAMVDLHGELTTAQYDGFGRIVALYKADPNLSNVGKQPSAASTLIDYTLPTDPTAAPYSIIHSRTQNGLDAQTATYQEAYGFVDGMGRTVATLHQADPSASDAGQWIVKDLADYDAKGAARRKYLAWFWNGTPAQFPLVTALSVLYGSQRYDAFGRQIQTFGLDGTVTLQSVHHALSTDKWDAADLLPGPHQGTPATATEDGHGRAIAVTERIHRGTSIEAHDTQTTYLSTGEPAVIRRVRVGATDPQVVRWVQYDSLGRMVLNVEPNATTGFVGPPSLSVLPAAPPATVKTWRYAYDDNGDLVGTSDARGCGANYLYDAAGRIRAEDFSPCLSSHVPYSAPNLVTGDGTEAFYNYDAYDADTARTAGLPGTAATVALGRVTSISDRGSKTALVYDGRGRIVQTFRRVAQPAPSDALATRYAPHWYAQSVSFDAADRPVTASTGVDSDVTALLDATGQSVVTTQYSQRGTVKSVTSGYGGLVTSLTRDADGLVAQTVYGDVAKTTTAFSYDGRRRLSSVQTYRGAPSIWSTPPASYVPAPASTGPPTTFQLLLEDADYVYDDVDNPVEARDWRNPAEWPAGARPVTRKIQYDDLYRATQVTYASPGGPDPWVSPFDAEDRGIDPDPRRAQSTPRVSFANRVQSQSFRYDWLGNTTSTDDDAHGFYDRSLGTITNGSGTAPYQLNSAAGTGGARAGSLTAAYDASGNVTSLAVTRAGPCLPAGSLCSQRFGYDWDEVGRLVHARRWDTAMPGAASSPLPTSVPRAELRYAYDASNDRMLKTSIDSKANTVFDAYVFDSLELIRTTWTGTDYVRSATTEVAYLSAHGTRLARLHFALANEPALSSAKLHVLFELPDHLGSTSIVIDRDTSELVERGTYMANGVPDSDYRPVRWNSFREDLRFTGKEEDIEVGLQYFGKRFLNPMLGRWMGPDPLSLHGLRSTDPNLYMYVQGQLLRSVDPAGLQGFFSALKESVTSGSFGPSSPIGQYISHENFVGSSIIQNDATLQKMQTVATAVAVGAASVATGGLVAEAVAGAAATGGTVTTAALSGAASGAASGIVERTGTALGQGASVGQAIKHGLNPLAIAKDAAIGGATGVAFAIAGKVVKTVVSKVAGKGGCAGGSCGVPRVGCFVAGTQVATAGGSVRIDNIALGDRVLPDAATCHDGDQELTARVDFVAQDEAGNPLEMSLLRSSAWLASLGAGEGQWVYVDLPEMLTHGWGQVLRVQAVAPPVDGPGCVVTGLYRRSSNDLVTVHFASAGEVEATASHRFFSESRGDWVAASDLVPGEALETLTATARVASVDVATQQLPVYNLEVSSSHRYFVGEASVEAHNASCNTSRAARREVMREQGIPTSQQPVSQSQNASGRSYEYEVPKPGGGTEVKSVQQQTLDRSHPGEGHWEAGRVKTDPNTGEVRMNEYDRPKLTNDKSKADYE